MSKKDVPPQSPGWWFVHTKGEGVHPAWWSAAGKYLVSMGAYIKMEDFKRHEVRFIQPVVLPEIKE